jgi:hypothetical protein
MSSENARNIVELRQLLAERFPGVRMSAERQESISEHCPTGIPPIDESLRGGLPRGAITEIVSSGVSSGSLLFLGSILHQARKRGEWLALVDSTDCFDPAGLDSESLSRLLWVRCSEAKQAIKATDMLLHDGTISVVALDLLFCTPPQLRKIPSSTWFRLQRILEYNSTALVVLAPEHMVSNARARLTLEKRFTLDSLDQLRETLFAQITPAPPEIATRRIVKIA